VSELASSGDERAAFLEAIEESLRPLMRIVLAYGVSYMDLLEVVRGLYISALRDRLQDQGRPVTVARLGLMAGVNRGEVEKIFQYREQRRQLRSRNTQKIDELSLLLGKWHDDPKFSTPYGAPLDLSLQPERGFRTFDELIAAANPTLDRETVIDELVANGCIEVHDNRFVRCTNRAFVATGADVSRIARLGRYVGALNSTFAHNLLRDPSEPSYFERTTLSDFPLSVAARDEVLARLREDGRDFVDGLDRWIAGKESEFADKNGRHYGVTVFFYEDRGSSEVQGRVESVGLAGNA
jgi:hypothetical protein